MTEITLGVFLPHEVVASFYNFRSGDLFYGMLTGTPRDARLIIGFVLVLLSSFWNADL